MAYLDYISESSIHLKKGNSLSLKKTKSSRYPAENYFNADYPDDLTLLINKTCQNQISIA